MSVVYLKIVDDVSVRGITTLDGIHIFSAYDFISAVCKKTGSYSRLLWKRLICDTSKFKHVNEDLLLASTSTKIRRRVTPGLTVSGLQRLLHIIHKKMPEDSHTIVESILSLYMTGDRSMIIEVDLNSTVTLFDAKSYRDILSLHYNFEPPVTT